MVTGPNEVTVNLYLGIQSRLSREAAAIERTTAFKQEIVNISQLGLPASIAVAGLGPNVDEEAILAGAISSLQGLISHQLVPVMDSEDACFGIPGTDIWIKTRKYLLYGLNTGVNLTIAQAVERWAKGRTEDPAVVQELRQVNLTLFANWQTKI